MTSFSVVSSLLRMIMIYVSHVDDLLCSGKDAVIKDAGKELKDPDMYNADPVLKECHI